MLFFVWIGISIFFASKIGPLTEEEEFIPKDHPAIIGWTIFKENFTEEVAVSKHVDIYLYWGLEDIDRTGENAWDPAFIGEIQFDNDFNPAALTSQNYMTEICQTLRTSELVSKEEPNEDELFWCWPEDF